MVATPAVSPETTPVVAPTETAPLTELHDPPEVTSDNVIEDPVHTVFVPEIGATEFTVTTAVD
jgi:hypothetical protein